MGVQADQVHHDVPHRESPELIRQSDKPDERHK
jgi:hypothetical protein